MRVFSIFTAIFFPNFAGKLPAKFPFYGKKQFAIPYPHFFTP
jgi:hypothetical protein